MNKHRTVERIAYGAIALVCFGLLLRFTGPGFMEEPGRRDVTIVVFGDSVFGECRDETSVTCQLEGMLGQQVYNCALGGTCFGRLDQERMLGYTKDCMNMSALATAIYAGDFSVQKSARIRENYTEYFLETIEGLAEIDFSAVEVVIIEHGLNDYHGGSKLTNEEEPYDEYTFSGAIRYTIQTLREAYPHLRIILVTPTYSWYLTKLLTCEEYDPGGGTMDLYVEEELRLARELGVEIIDVYHDFYPHEKWEDWQVYTRDGLHPNGAGRALLAQTLAAYLKERSGAVGQTGGAE